MVGTRAAALAAFEKVRCLALGASEPRVQRSRPGPFPFTASTPGSSHELSRRQEGAPRERRGRHRPRHRRRPRLRQSVHAAHHPPRARARGVLRPPPGRCRHGAARFTRGCLHGSMPGISSRVAPDAVRGRRGGGGDVAENLDLTIIVRGGIQKRWAPPPGPRSDLPFADRPISLPPAPSVYRLASRRTTRP